MGKLTELEWPNVDENRHTVRYDDNLSFINLQPEQIRDSFKELQENQDQALITILPIIAREAAFALLKHVYKKFY